jgi:hypothetical protein
VPDKYYRLNGRKLKLSEYARLCTDWFTLVVAVIAKPFGGILPKITVVYPDELKRITLAEVPESVEKSLLRQIAKFEDAGYRVALTYELQVLEENRLNVSVNLISRDGFSLAQVFYESFAENSKILLSVGHFHPDGNYSIVTTRKKELDTLGPVHILRRPGSSVDDILDDYEDVREDWSGPGEEPVPLTTETLTKLLHELEVDNIEHLIKRGVLVPMTERELAKYDIDQEDE